MPQTAAETSSTGTYLSSGSRSAGSERGIRRLGPALYLVPLSVAYFVPTSIRAARERLWFDEILTFDASSLLPSVSALWSFLNRGLELNPPLGFVLAAASESVFGKNEFALRLPFVIAFWIMSLCLYAFLARRIPRPFAIAGMLLPVLTAAGRYSYEARPYALVLALAGVALVAWQAAAEGRRRRVALVTLAVALAAALCSQPLAVTLALPFGLGEITRTIQRKRVDWPVWCAFGSATPALWLLWRLKGAAGAAASTQNVADPLHYVGLSYFLILLPAMIPVGAAILLLLMSGSQPGRQAATHRVPGYEWAALIGFAAIPFAAVPISTLGGPYCPRYSLNAVIGLAGCLALLLCRLAGSRSRQAGTAMAALLTVFFLVDQVLPTSKRLSSGIEQSKSAALQGVLEGLPADNLPIVIGQQLSFLELERYGSPALATRLYYLTDPLLAARPRPCANGAPCRTANVLFDVNGPVLKELFPFRSHFAEYRSFVAHCKRFLATEPGWVVAQLAADGADLQLRGTLDGARYYEVTLP